MKVSDHAIVRWIHRYHELDTSLLKKEICKLIPDGYNDGRLYIPNLNLTLVICSGTVVTVLPGSKVEKHLEKQKQAQARFHNRNRV